MDLSGPSNRDIPSDDELDAILNGTLDGKDIFDTSNLEAQSSQTSGNKKLPGQDVLGLEEEIRITKKKQPIPKLDGKLLLSELGVPKLQKISKDRLKLKGKGHEYGDVARLLNMYQLWLDGMYPRAKFADGLSMIEKLGHTKEIQMMRKDWIDEGKSRGKPDQVDDSRDATMADQPTQESNDADRALHADVSPIEHREGSIPIDRAGDTTRTVEMGPAEDELDALLAEAEAESGDRVSNSVTAAEDPFAEDMEAMAEMEDMW